MRVGRDDPGAPLESGWKRRAESSRPTEGSKSSYASHVSPAAKHNPPPQFANWGTSFRKEAFFVLKTFLRRNDDERNNELPIKPVGRL